MGVENQYFWYDNTSKIQEKSTLFKGVAADDFFFSNLMDPTWNVKINVFDGYLATKENDFEQNLSKALHIS